MPPSNGEIHFEKLYSDIQVLLDKVLKEKDEDVRRHMIKSILELQIDIYGQIDGIGMGYRFWKRSERLQQIAGMSNRHLRDLIEMYDNLSANARSVTQTARSVQRPIMPRAEIAEQWAEHPPPFAGHLVVPRLTTTISNISIRGSYGAQAGHPSQQPSNPRSRSEHNLGQSLFSEQYEGHRREPSEPSVLQPLWPNPNSRRTTPNDNIRGSTQIHRAALDLPRNPHVLHNNPPPIAGGHRRQETAHSLPFGYPISPSEQSHYSGAAFHTTQSGFGNQPINRSIDHGVARPDSFYSHSASSERGSSAGSYVSSGPRRTSEGSSSRGFSMSGGSNEGGSHVSQEQWENTLDEEGLYVTLEEFYGSRRNRTSSQHPQGGPGGHFPQQ